MTKQGNFKVIVDLPIGAIYDRSERGQRTLCEQIMESIRRHVDDVGYVSYRSDTLCTHCNSTWETEQSDFDPVTPFGQPLCCEEARKEWESNQAGQEKKPCSE